MKRDSDEGACKAPPRATLPHRAPTVWLSIEQCSEFRPAIHHCYQRQMLAVFLDLCFLWFEEKQITHVFEIAKYLEPVVDKCRKTERMTDLR